MLSKKNKMHIVNRNYRHKIEVWDLTSTEENDMLEDVQVPKFLYSLWAEVIPVRGKEYVSMDVLVPEMQYKITTRYRPNYFQSIEQDIEQYIDQAMLIKWQGKELNIKAIVDISGREEEMEIMCTEKVKTNG